MSEVIKPYVGDPQSPSRRRARRWLAILVCVFCLFYGLVYAFFTPYLLPVLAFPVAVLAGIVIWALPDVARPPIGALEAFFFATIAALVVWPNYLALALPGLPWITFSRLTGFPFAFLLTVCVSTSENFRQRTAAVLKASPVIWRLMVAFVLIEFLSIAFSTAKSESIQKFLIFQIAWTCSFFAAAYVFTKPRRADWFSYALWGMSIFVGVIGIWEHHLKHVVWLGHIPSFLQIENDDVRRILTPGHRAYTDIYRTQATFSTPLGLAEYLALTMPFIIHRMLSADSLRIKLAAGLSVPFLLYVILISGSRLGVVGFGLSVMIYGLVWAFSRMRRNPGDLLGRAIVLAYPVLFAIALGLSFVIGRLHKALWGGGAQQASTAARLTQWKMGMPLILKNPIGHGIGRGAETLGYFDPGGTLTIDSYYLLILLEFGIIGFIVYYGLILASIYNAGAWYVRRPRMEGELSLVVPLGVALSSFLVIKSVFSNTDNHALAFIMMGMICALVYRVRNDTADAEKAPTAAATRDLSRR